jgi:predicted DNA-binding transcriptional regulator AlpA
MTSKINRIIVTTEELMAQLIENSVRKAFNEFSPKSSYTDDKPMNIDETAAFLQMPKSSIYQLTSTRQIPFNKIGKPLFFFKKDLLAWLEEGKKKTQKQIEAEGFSMKGGVRK